MGSIERGERNLTIVSILTVAQHLEMTASQILSGLERRAAEFRRRSPGISAVEKHV
jgi:hypothetical protein